MKIIRTKTSTIDNIDFSNIPFGTVFSDHMLLCHYKDGIWNKPEIRPYGPIPMNPGTQVFHYGQAVFEGMKAFKNQKGEVLLFRKEENFKRLNHSAKRLSIPELPEDIFMEGLNSLLKLDSNWIRRDDKYSLYIRPFIFASSECIKASSSEDFTFIIITSPTTSYYSGELNVVIEENYTRAARGGVGYTKASGNYAASFYPTKQANKRGFNQLIWTDSVSHEYIEESGTMNIWFRIGDTLVTPELSDSILGGITRDSIVKLARDIGIVVEERKIRVDEIVRAYKSSDLKEVFGTGTAVVVNPIKSITFREEKFIFSDIEDSFAIQLKKSLQDIQWGRVEDIYNWTTKI